LVSELLELQCLAQHSTRQCLHPRHQGVVGGRDRQMERRGSSFPVEVHAHVVGRKGRLVGMEESNLIQSSLVCLATTTSTVGAVVTTRASMRPLDREASTTRAPPATASATTARPSLTSTATPMEHAEGRTTLDGLGVTQLDGATLAVETFSLPAGSQTTPGLIEPAPQVVDLEMSIKMKKRKIAICIHLKIFSTRFLKVSKENFLIRFCVSYC